MPKLAALSLEIALLTLLPLYLMTTQSSVLAARPLLMALGLIYCLIRFLRSRVHLTDLGLTLTNFTPAIRALALPSVFLILFSYLLVWLAPAPTRHWLFGVDPLSISSFSSRLAFYAFASAPVQELIFRGYFTWRLKQVFRQPIWIYLLSVSIFTLLHLPFRSLLMVLIALAMGILYLANYLSYRNLLAVALSHALVGTALIILRQAYLPYT